MRYIGGFVIFIIALLCIGWLLYGLVLTFSNMAGWWRVFKIIGSIGLVFGVMLVIEAFKKIEGGFGAKLWVAIKRMGIALGIAAILNTMLCMVVALKDPDAGIPNSPATPAPVEVPSVPLPKDS